MKNLILATFAGAVLLSAPAFAQMGTAEATGAAAPSKGGAASMPANGAMSGDAMDSTKAMPAKRHHHHMAMSESKMDASEAETTKQLNMQQSQNTMPSGGMNSSGSMGTGMSNNSMPHSSMSGTSGAAMGNGPATNAAMGNNSAGSGTPK